MKSKGNYGCTHKTNVSIRKDTVSVPKEPKKSYNSPAKG